MREFNQDIYIYPFQTLLSPDTPFSELQVISDSTLDWEEKIKESASGVYYEQLLHVIIDRELYQQLSRCNPSTLVWIRLNDGLNSYTWGDSNIPVIMKITPSINKFTLKFSRNSTKPLIL